MSYPDQKLFLESLRHGLAPVNEAGNVLLAVSGGADSVALLRGTLALPERSSWRIGVAHFNHMLRGEDSVRDAEWLEQVCSGLGVEFVVGAAPIPEIASESGQGIEETARKMRYEFLSKTARRNGFAFVATAHTKDDQVETILHHIVRGTGLAGLRGMRSQRELSPATADDEPPVSLLRPMLNVTRGDAEQFLRELQQDYRNDPSNRDPGFTRNRIRHELLPQLEEAFNPQVRKALAQLGQQAAELHEAWEVLAARLLVDAVVDAGADIGRLRVDKLCSQPRPLIRECFALFWKRQDWPRRRMSQEHFESLADVTLHGGTTTLPGGITAQRRDGLVVLRRAQHD